MKIKTLAKVAAALLMVSVLAVIIYQYPYKKYIIREKFNLYLEYRNIPCEEIASMEVVKEHFATAPVVVVTYESEMEFTYLYSYYGNYDTLEDYNIKTIKENYIPHHCLVRKGGQYLSENSYYYKSLKYLL